MAEPRVPTGTICANERFVPLHSGDSTPHHGPSCRSGGCIGARRLGTKSTQYRVNESVTTLRLLRPFLRLLLPLLLLLLIALPFFARFAHRVLFVRFDRKMRWLAVATRGQPTTSARTSARRSSTFVGNKRINKRRVPSSSSHPSLSSLIPEQRRTNELIKTGHIPEQCWCDIHRWKTPWSLSHTPPPHPSPSSSPSSSPPSSPPFPSTVWRVRTSL